MYIRQLLLHLESGREDVGETTAVEVSRFQYDLKQVICPGSLLVGPGCRLLTVRGFLNSKFLAIVFFII